MKRLLVLTFCLLMALPLNASAMTAGECIGSSMDINWDTRPPDVYSFFMMVRNDCINIVKEEGLFDEVEDQELYIFGFMSQLLYTVYGQCRDELDTINKMMGADDSI